MESLQNPTAAEPGSKWDSHNPEYILNSERVLFTECSLCQKCITVCAPEALKLSFGFDLGRKEFLRERIQTQ